MEKNGSNHEHAIKTVVCSANMNPAGGTVHSIFAEHIFEKMEKIVFVWLLRTVGSTVLQFKFLKSKNSAWSGSHFCIDPMWD